MLPQLAAIPLQSTTANNDSGQNLNRLLPVGQNVSATVVAVSRDQIQPEIFRLKLEVNNRLIQMGVFQPLPVGQKINVNRQSDGQIQISVQPQQTTGKTDSNPQPSIQTRTTGEQAAVAPQPYLTKLSIPNSEAASKIPNESRILAAVISSRPIYINQAAAAATQPGPSAPVNTVPATPTQIQPSSTQAFNSTTSTTSPGPVAQTTLQTATQTTSIQAASTQAISNTNTAPPSSTNTTNTTAPIVTGSTQSTISTGGQQTNITTPITPQPNPVLTATAQNNVSQPTPPPSTQSASTGNIQSNPNTEGPRQTQATQPTAPSQTQSPPQQSSPAVQTQTIPTRPSGPPIHHVVTLALPDGSKLETVSTKPLPQGTQMQVEKTGNDLQILRIKEPPLSQTSALDKPAIQEVLRNSLPNQIPTGNAFNQLTTALQNDTSQTSQISSVVRTMLQLFGVRPGSPEAPSQIKQNVELGGHSTERMLSKGIAPQPQEMRSQLSQLQQLAEKLPEAQKERLEQLINGIQSRITSQQLTSLQQWRELPDGGFERVIQLDLPIKQGERWENLELHLSREGGSNSAGEMISVWRVRLHFDLDELGGVDAEIRLTDGHEISTLFWCEQPQTAERLRQRSEEFSERLRECGFNNTEVNWHEGSAPEQKQVLHKQLVDLHT